MSKSTVVTIAGLARRLGVCSATVFLWLRRGLILPGRRIGRQRVWTTAEATAVVMRARLARRKTTEMAQKVTRTADGQWRCPACGKNVSRANSPAAVQFHLRCCPTVWREACTTEEAQLLARTTEPTLVLRGKPARVRSRKELMDIAERVVVGVVLPEVFVVAVKVRLARIRLLQNELYELQEN